MRLVQSLALAAVAIAPTGVFAQSCCGQPAAQPTIAYAPVVPQVAAAPVVQQTTVASPWYPGKYLTDFTRNLFGLNRTTTTYTAGYAPYTVGYTPYTAAYAPAAPTVVQRTAYRPVYPATWGPVVPFTQTVSRPVVLSPVVAASPCCDTCVASPCSSCAGSCPGGVCQAGFNAPAAPSYPSNSGQPSLAPGDQVPAVRGERSIRQRQEIDDFPPLPSDIDDQRDTIQSDPAGTNSYWGAPPLFAPPSNRVTRNTHPAPVRTAVYNRAPSVQRTAYRPALGQSTGKVNRVSADSWGAGE